MSWRTIPWLLGKSKYCMKLAAWQILPFSEIHHSRRQSCTFSWWREALKVSKPVVQFTFSEEATFSKWQKWRYCEVMEAYALLRTDHGRPWKSFQTGAHTDRCFIKCKVRHFNHKQFRQLSFSSAAPELFPFLPCGAGMNVISAGDASEKFNWQYSQQGYTYLVSCYFGL